MSVQEIKEAVRGLRLEERAEVAAGTLDKIPAQVDVDIVKNNIRKMP